MPKTCNQNMGNDKPDFKTSCSQNIDGRNERHLGDFNLKKRKKERIEQEGDDVGAEIFVRESFARFGSDPPADGCTQHGMQFA